jgi:hypothetical protein
MTIEECIKLEKQDIEHYIKRLQVSDYYRAEIKRLKETIRSQEERIKELEAKP